MCSPPIPVDPNAFGDEKPISRKTRGKSDGRSESVFAVSFRAYAVVDSCSEKLKTNKRTGSILLAFA